MGQSAATGAGWSATRRTVPHSSKGLKVSAGERSIDRFTRSALSHSSLFLPPSPPLPSPPPCTECVHIPLYHPPLSHGGASGRSSEDSSLPITGGAGHSVL